MKFKGFDLEEIDQVAAEMINTVDAYERELILLAACKAVVLLADEEELDGACVIIDELNEMEEEE